MTTLIPALADGLRWQCSQLGIHPPVLIDIVAAFPLAAIILSRVVGKLSVTERDWNEDTRND
jgi:hypothetical protein